VRLAPPTSTEIARCRTILRAEPGTSGHLARLGDKALLFDPQDRAFLMYGVRARSWIAMGDAVGAPGPRRALAARFLDLCADAGGRAAFYQVGEEDLATYLGLGLALYKIGEEARVALAGFGLEGGALGDLRLPGRGRTRRTLHSRCDDPAAAV